MPFHCRKCFVWPFWNQVQNFLWNRMLFFSVPFNGILVSDISIILCLDAFNFWSVTQNHVKLFKFFQCCRGFLSFNLKLPNHPSSHHQNKEKLFLRLSDMTGCVQLYKNVLFSPFVHKNCTVLVFDFLKVTDLVSTYFLSFSCPL